MRTAWGTIAHATLYVMIKKRRKKPLLLAHLDVCINSQRLTFLSEILKALFTKFSNFCSVFGSALPWLGPNKHSQFPKESWMTWFKPGVRLSVMAETTHLFGCCG